MIKFFRKIRQKLLSENRFSKYLIYAIGEIVLVVIGILIALQINNWNELQKKEKIESVFLQDFSTDLNTDIKTLKAAIIVNNERIAAADSIISILSFKNDLTNVELTDFANYNISLTSESYFIPEKSAIRQFESSNGGNIISSKKLKNKLFRYYALNERVEQNMEKSMQLYQHNFITKSIAEVLLAGNILKTQIGSDLNRQDLNLNELRDNSEYLYSVMSKRIGTITQNRVYQTTINAAEELVNLINDEMSK